jgi:hypothetical protein
MSSCICDLLNLLHNNQFTVKDGKCSSRWEIITKMPSLSSLGFGCNRFLVQWLWPLPKNEF